MRIIYDRETDTLTIIFTDTPVAESDEDKPGIILDYDAAGNLVSMEILDASRRVRAPSQIEYQVAPVAVPAAA
jgi:YD repeat-containing protein